MHTQWRLLTLLLLIIGIASIATIWTPTNAQTNERCFPETGYCISGAIRSYWEARGGLTVFGYPISDIQYEKLGDWTGPVQWFERDRLEEHGLYGVMAGRLGAYLLQLQGHSWYSFEQVDTAPDGCRYFPETRHSLCEPFLSYWETHGNMERFGYPITEPLFETIDDSWSGTVQYFERRRMELHPELPNTPILLGLLGQEVRDTLAQPLPDSSPTDSPSSGNGLPTSCTTEVLPELQAAYALVRDDIALGCPTEDYSIRTKTATQDMANGVMLWLDHSYAQDDSGPYIYAVVYPGPTFKQYEDDWVPGRDPYVPNIAAPSGYHVPRGGFGKVWKADAELRYALDGAIEREEQEQMGAAQDFASGVLIQLDSGKVFAFGNPDEPTAVVVNP